MTNTVRKAGDLRPASTIVSRGLQSAHKSPDTPDRSVRDP